MSDSETCMCARTCGCESRPCGMHSLQLDVCSFACSHELSTETHLSALLSLFLAALGRVGFSSAVPMPRKNALCLLPRFLPHVAFGVCRYDGISSLEFF